MKIRIKEKLVAMSLAVIMTAAPVWGTAFATDEVAIDQPDKPVAESYKDNDKIEDYNKKVDEYNSSAKKYNESVDKEYEAAVEETNKKNAEIDQHNEAETERVKAAEEKNAQAVLEAEEKNKEIDEANKAEEERVNAHNSEEDAKVEASKAAKESAEKANEEAAAHNDAVTQYEADYEQYLKDKTMEDKILAIGYTSVQHYNDTINSYYNEPARKSVEMNAVSEIKSVADTYELTEAAEKSGVEVKVIVRHIFEGTDVSYTEEFTIDANDTILLKSIGATGSATQPGYATFYHKTDSDHSMGYWMEAYSCLETTAKISDYGWNCGDTHTVSYSAGKSHANDEEVIEMTYNYMWSPLKEYKTYNVPVEPENPGVRKEMVEVPELYEAQYETFVAAEHVSPVLEEIIGANIIDNIEGPVRKAYMELLGYMDLFEEPEEVIPAAEITAKAIKNNPVAPAAAKTAKTTKAAKTETATQETLIAEQEVPMAEQTAASPAMIEDAETPLAEGAYWALLNLIMTIITGLISAVLLVRYFGRKEKENEDEIEETEEQTNRKGFARIMSIIPAIGAVVAFILTENMSNPMALTDGWTILMAAILAVQAVIAIIAKKSNEDEEDDEMAEAMNA